MKIEIGDIFHTYDEPSLGINIEGVGIFQVMPASDEEPFQHVYLTKKDLKKLKKQIDIHLNDY
jgi:hypothetical protein